MPVFNQALCRKCGRAYDPNKTRADWRGYCSMACQHQMARDLGYRPGKYVQAARLLAPAPGSPSTTCSRATTLSAIYPLRLERIRSARSRDFVCF
jgi:hypothetical protein